MDQKFLSRHGYVYQKSLYEYDDGDSVSVGLFRRESDDRLLAIKTHSADFQTLEYEAQVSKKVYQASLELPEELRVIAEPVDFLVKGERGYVVSEFVPGKTLSSFVSLDWSTLGEERQRSIKEGVATLLRKLRALQKATQFTHYDLHLGNIITNDDMKTFKIIDFGTSHFPGHTGWCQAPIVSLAIGVVPSVSDPWYDLVRVVVIFYIDMERALPSEAKKILDDAGFNNATLAKEVQEKSREAKQESHGDKRRVLVYQTYPGSERLYSAEILSTVSPMMWSAGRHGHGFWVVDGANVDMQRPDLRNFKNTDYFDTGIGTRVRFGELVACLKRHTVRRRKCEDLDRFLLLITADLVGHEGGSESLLA